MLAASFLAALRRRIIPLLAVLASAGLLTSSTPMPASRIEAFSFASKALGRTLAVSVYMPEGAAPLGGWPVLYLLHGLGGSEADWVRLGGLKTTLDRLVETGHVRPMMVVMPCGASSWYVDSGAVGGPGDYETAIVDELPRIIQARYPVAVSPQGRAIAGVSMGGYGALRLALKHPEMFSAVASMSGAIWQNLPVATASAGAAASYDAFRDQVYYRRGNVPPAMMGIDLPPIGTHFGMAFGAPFDAKRFNAENVFTLLDTQIARGRQLPAIFLTVGDNDSHNLWRGSIALYQTLRADRQPVEFRVTDGDHTWSLWKRSIEDTLLFVDGHFGNGRNAIAEADMGAKTL